jgi:dTDP-glucose pyrophosphorylase
MDFADSALHKALAPLGNRAVLSHVIEGFPDDARFVVAVGHHADQIRAYLALAHPDRDITIVHVPNYMGPGSGPGRSVLACAEHLPEPFALTAADSIVSGMPPLAGTSWMGVSTVDDPTSYLTLETGADGHVAGFQERTGPSPLAFVGLAWIAEPDVFLDAARTAAFDGELQVTPGFAGLLAAGARVDAAPVDWIDTGTTETYAEARRRFAEEPHGGRAAIDVTYLLADRVVKWFRDPAGADLRVDRARDLGDAAPAIVPAPAGWLATASTPTASTGCWTGPPPRCGRTAPAVRTSRTPSGASTATRRLRAWRPTSPSATAPSRLPAWSSTACRRRPWPRPWRASSTAWSRPPCRRASMATCTRAT